MYAFQIFEAPETLEQRVVEAAVPGDAIRFSFTADMKPNVDRETNSDDDEIGSIQQNDGRTIVIFCGQINLEVFS